ncbi:MAG: single-stranded DNA-binding protein [Nitrospirae bacterium]|nr:single-stranded DNA-binding protein [Nitrospirota bacterium]
MVKVEGNVGSKPEVKPIPGGVKVANFSIAQNETKKGKKSTEWVKVKAFGKLADLVEAHVNSGDFIGVSGTFSVESWDSPEKGR